MIDLRLPVVLAGCLAGILACSEYESHYFKDKVNDATAERVAKRYGAPHKLVKGEGGRMIWTYYDRGSGTASYSGYANSHYCRSYVLTFDQDEILRDWKQEDCKN